MGGADVLPNRNALSRPRELAAIYLEAPEVTRARHTRPFHSTVERTPRAGSWLRAVAGRSVGRGPGENNAGEE